MNNEPSPAVDSNKFWRDGYLIVRNVFRKSEIEAFRQMMYDTRDLTGDLLSNPRLRNILLDPRILDIAQQLLGQTPVYWGESTAQIGVSPRGWHKDNVDRENMNGPDWRGKYDMIKFAVYPQDHYSHSGGLNIRRGSHNTTLLDGLPRLVGQNRYMNTRIGDVIVWNMRATHSGSGFLLKFPRWLQLEPDCGPRLPYSLDFIGRLSQKLHGRRTSLAKIPNLLIAPQERERCIIFFTMGADGPHLNRYLAYLKTRKFMIDIWSNSLYDESVWEAAKDKNIVIRDMRQEIKHEAGLGCENFDYGY
jgi:hypothetical protein